MMQTQLARHGKPKLGMTYSQIAKYREQHKPLTPTLQPHIEPESSNTQVQDVQQARTELWNQKARALKAQLAEIQAVNPFLDLQGMTKPTGRVWMNGKTIWFQVYRLSRVEERQPLVWIPITRTHTATPARRKMVRRILNAREQAAQDMLDAGKAQAFRLIDRVYAAIAVGQAAELVAAEMEVAQ
jgi:hypothetical protein